MLTSAGIAPKNGWIADYPVTPDIIGELQNAIDDVAESGGLSMSRDEATKTLENLTVEVGLPVMASGEGVDQFADSKPPGGYGSYLNPETINDYYENEGPPIVTYYPPPADYSYMYSWVPYPFWWSGFWFAGYYCLHDFDRIIVVNHGHHRFSNHYSYPHGGRTDTIDPARRGMHGHFREDSDRPRHHDGYSSPEARRGASSILGRSRGHERSGGSAIMNSDRRPDDRSSFSRDTTRSQGQQHLNSGSNTSTLRSRSNDQVRPRSGDHRVSTPPAQNQGNPGGSPSGSHGMMGRTPNQPNRPSPNFDRRSQMDFQRPSAGVIRPSSPPSQPSTRSVTSPSQGSARSFSPSFSSPSRGNARSFSRSFSSPSQGNTGSFGRSFSSPSQGNAGSFGRSLSSPSLGSARSFGRPSTGGSGSLRTPRTGGKAGGVGHRGF
jgi:hypothetical protein